MLNDAEVMALKNSSKFQVEPASVVNEYRHGIRSQGWVGQIPVGDELLVRIVPKVLVNNLFRMLEIAYNLSSFHLFKGDIEIESVEDIYERIVSILSRLLIDRARKGLYRGYIGESDDLSYVRGRLDPLGAVLNGVRGIPKIPCSYEEHTPDLKDNRILYWALHQVRRQGIRREKVKSELDRARRALAGTISLERFSPKDCVQRFYHRVNYDYQPMHGLCRFILEQTGPGIHAGDRNFIPFEVDMPRLFELFVAEWVRANAPPGLTVRRQYKAGLVANYKLDIHIDILICKGDSATSDRCSRHEVQDERAASARRHKPNCLLCGGAAGRSWNVRLPFECGQAFQNGSRKEDKNRQPRFRYWTIVERGWYRILGFTGCRSSQSIVEFVTICGRSFAVVLVELGAPLLPKGRQMLPPRSSSQLLGRGGWGL